VQAKQHRNNFNKNVDRRTNELLEVINSEKKDSVSIVYEELESNGVEANQNEERRPSRTRQIPTRLQEFEITRLQGY
jgi:hypothetical protein